MPPLHMILDNLLFGMLPAALVAAAVMFVLTLYRRPWVGPVAAALALVAAVVVGSWVRKSAVLQPEKGTGPLAVELRVTSVGDSLSLEAPGSDWNRLPLAALAALAAGLVARVPGMPAALGWPSRAAAVALAVTWAVPPTADAVVEYRWLPAAIVLIVSLSWGLLEHLARETPGGAMPFCLGLAAFAGGAVLIHARSGRLMEPALVLSLALMGVAAVAAWRRVDGGGALPGGLVALMGLLLMGRSTTFSEVPWTSFALPAVAPLALALTLLPPVRGWRGWKLAAARLLLILLPLAGAVGLAMEAEELHFGDEWQ